MPGHHHALARGLFLGEHRGQALLGFSLALRVLQVIEATELGERGPGSGEFDFRVFDPSP